jgi:uncharacterized protein with NRDE domain
LDSNPRFPLVLAANRDERLRRPATAPQLWERSPPLLAGRDLEAGGTWLGVNAAGLVAGLTNLWEGRAPDPRLASRGAVVLGLLAHRELEQAKRWIQAEGAGRTNPYIAVCADRSGRGFCVESQPTQRLWDLGAGVHVFGNQSPESEPAKTAQAVRDVRASFAARRGDGADEILAALKPALARHRGARGPLESVCVHTETGFGTVSSTCILLGEAESAYFHAAGPPCTTGFDSYEEPLRRLLGH